MGERERIPKFYPFSLWVPVHGKNNREKNADSQMGIKDTGES